MTEPMPKLIYAEPDDEITNLVDRLRSEKTEKELVFVLPGSSRVMHSNLNARLLKQYSNSLGKVTSVVSPDPRTQSVAIETGFSVFPTMAAFESGKAIDKAVSANSSVPATPSVLGPLPVQAEEFEPVPAPRRTGSVGPPPVVPARTKVPAARAAAGAAAAAARTGYVPYVLGGVGVLLIGVILFLFVLPSATVQVVIPARAISASPTITGSTAAPGPTDTATIQTIVQQAQEQQMAATVASTGQKQIPAVASTGTVVFTYEGNVPFVPAVRFPAGTEVGTDDGKKYVTTADSGAVPAGGGTSGAIPIQARVGGKVGDTAAGTVKNITNNPNPSNFQVKNSADVTGGVDATTKTVVSQADQDGVKKSLGDQLTTKVKADLLKSAGNQKLLDETLVVSVDASFDRKPGDEAPNFNGTVTVKASQVSLDEKKVKEVLKTSLKKQAPVGYELTDNPPKLTWTLAQHDDKGAVVLNGAASGFMATAINKEDIRSHITGKSIAKARAYIQGNIDSSNVFISESPSLVPWLPYIGGRIDIRTTVENTTPG
jgi:hypothetical protein